jgi:hypothetical protein
MSATAPTTYRLTVHDQREQKLNSSPALKASYNFDCPGDAEVLGQFLLQRGIQAPGCWRVAIAGGVRELSIDEIVEEAQ